MGLGTRAAAVVGAIALLGAGYVIADANDVVPGVITTQPPYPSPRPFPTAPGAVAAPAVARDMIPVSSDAPEPDPATVQRAVDALAADTRLGGQVGVLVTDLATGKTLGERSSGTAMIPASTLKLFTAAAALTTLDPDGTLATRAVLDGKSTVVLVGGGDMLLSAGAGNDSAVNGRAGLGDLAQQVADKLTLSGATTVSLRVDDTLFPGPAISPAWEPVTVTQGYAAPVTALAVDIAKLGPDEYAKRSPDPSMAAAAIFARALAEKGITVDGTVQRATAPADAQPLGAVQSAPIADIVSYFLEYSDNTITETVGRLVAIKAGLPGSADGAPKAVHDAVSALGVDLTGALIADCSGLGNGSLVTPTQLDAVVTLLADPGHPKLRSAAIGLPIGGLSGTLADRFLKNGGRGVVRAKTGTLPNVTSLAGTVVTKDNRQLSFAVMVNNVPAGGNVGARIIVDSFVSTLAGCGCTS